MKIADMKENRVLLWTILNFHSLSRDLYKSRLKDSISRKVDEEEVALLETLQD